MQEARIIFIAGLGLLAAGLAGACSSSATNDGQAGAAASTTGPDGNPGSDGGGAASDAAAASTADGGANAVAPTSAELSAKYFPNGPLSENKRVICPFLRLMESSGVFYKTPEDLANRFTSNISVPLQELIQTALGFGCVGGCDSVATIVSGLQATQVQGHPAGSVDLAYLYQAKPVSHDCGLAFGLGDTEVSDTRRDQTLRGLQTVADAKPGSAQGTLDWRDIYTAKLQTCAGENTQVTDAGKIEVDLIYAYLGGPDRGFVNYSDVALLLHGQLPATKLAGPLLANVIGKIDSDNATARAANSLPLPPP